MAADERRLSIPQALSILSLSPSASQDDVQAAWRKAAQRTHPDRNPGEDPQVARRKFEQVQEAYRVLTDPAAIAERRFATSNAPQAPYGVDQLEAFRILGLGPRATYEEIDARVAQLMASETDVSKRLRYDGAHELLTKAHREAQEAFFLGKKPQYERVDWLANRPAPRADATSGISAILFVLTGLGLVVGAILLLGTSGHQTIAVVAMVIGALACFVGALRWKS